MSCFYFLQAPCTFVVVFSSEIGLLFGIICTHMNGHVRTSNLKGRWFLGVHQAKKRGRDNEEAATSSTSSSTSSASDGSKSIFSKLKVPQIPVWSTTSPCRKIFCRVSSQYLFLSSLLAFCFRYSCHERIIFFIFIVGVSSCFWFACFFSFVLPYFVFQGSKAFYCTQTKKLITVMHSEQFQSQTAKLAPEAQQQVFFSVL